MLVVPVASLMLLIFGASLFMSFVSLHLKALALSEMAIGITQSCFFAGLLLGSLRGERLIIGRGHSRTLSMAALTYATATLSLALLPASWWFTLRFIAGLCEGVFYVGIESWLITARPPHQRGRVLAVYTVALYLAQTFSQMVLPIAERHTVAAFAVSTTFLALAAIPTLLRPYRAALTRHAPPVKLGALLRLSPLGFAGCFSSGLILSALYSFMPVYIRQRGFEPGYLMSAMLLGGTLWQWPIGRLSDRLPRPALLNVLACLGLVPLVVLPFSTSVWPLAVALFCLGGVSFCIYPVAVALGCDGVPQADLVKMSGLLLFVYGCGSVLGPLLSCLPRPYSDEYLVIMLALYLCGQLGFGLTRQRLKAR